jgi:hypothetical protein
MFGKRLAYFLQCLPKGIAGDLSYGQAIRPFALP